ncbi:hypothetical protein BASA81_001227 [Batrachochytrium salamandrivorans]|nr:hypothetical protein BASA81_001227 [Batrachochytrium salamandrivorans]
MKIKGNRPAQKQRGMKRSVDAWDTGRSERARSEKSKVAAAASSSKRLKFDPKPPTFIAATRAEMLTQRMGGFAGPLLGALWNEQEDEEDGIIIRSSKPGEGDGAAKNKFGLLESSDEEGAEKEAEPNPFEVKPAAFANAANWTFGVPQRAVSNDPWQLKEPTFKLDAVPPPKPEFVLKPSLFQLPTAAATEELSDDDL